MSYTARPEPNLLDDSVAQHNDTAKSTDNRISLAEQDTATMSSSTNTPSVPDITISQRMVSATVGSLLTSLLVTPLDVVRVRLQAQTTPQSRPINTSRFPAHSASFAKLPPDLGVKSCCKEVFFVGDNGGLCLASESASAGSGAGTITNLNNGVLSNECAVEETQRRTINSTMDGIRKIARNEGLSTLWRGLTPTLLMAIPANVIYFTGYDWLRYSSTSPIRAVSSDTYNPLVSGSVARIMAALVVSPVEMFRTRIQGIQGSNAPFRDTLMGMKQMVQAQGYTSLWRGLTLTMWRDVPFSALYWWGYEGLRNGLRSARGNTATDLIPSVSQAKNQAANESTSQTGIDSFLAGTIAGGFSAFVTTPFDAGKTRQQTYRSAGDNASSSAGKAAREAKKVGKVVPEELSMPRFLLHIAREEGAAGLFKGWAARCLKVAPACAIMISSYELGKKWAHGVNSQGLDEAVEGMAD